ncbi:KCNJ5 protein, partial [Amia calva]|nr:KCNJ5 protein [Amia calva]
MEQRVAVQEGEREEEEERVGLESGGGGPACVRGGCKLSRLSSLNSILSVEWRAGRAGRSPRLIGKSGRCALQCRGHGRAGGLQDPFNAFMDMSWPAFLLTFALVFAGSWTGFALLWWSIADRRGHPSPDPHGHSDPSPPPPCVTAVHSFSSAFLFSLETQTTIGYGARSVAAHCREGILLLVLQALAGIIIDCTMVGLMYTKLSRPENRSRSVLFSKVAGVALRGGQLCLMFRLADLRSGNKIVGGRVSATLVRKEVTQEGEVLPFHHTALPVFVDESGDTPFLPSPLCVTVCHEISESSPLYHTSAQSLPQEQFEVVVVFEGVFESTGQPFQIRSSYLPGEIRWGHRFAPVLSPTRGGEGPGFEIDFSRSVCI